MLLPSFNHIDTTYTHVYLSPHLDDAVLSCGGAIAHYTAAGERVLVVTLCTGAPNPSGPFSALAHDIHTNEWRLTPAQAMAARLREDDQALARLNADTFRAGLLDAIYRMPAIYDSREALFGPPARHDPLLPALRDLIAALRARLPAATLYAPLGVGGHVDHQFTYIAALTAGGRVAYYEDYPYAQRPGALSQRLDALGQEFASETLDIGTHLAHKIAAIEAYTSQLDVLFGGAAAMAEAVTAYAAATHPSHGTYTERVWRHAGSRQGQASNISTPLA
ncbi:MAG TPA: PIG-L family deacetylase [Kouleothrix sp.]|nr:PIG-L family deacetylase [Kouleothrix sp.]